MPVRADPVVTAAGVGFNYLTYINDQRYTNSGSSGEQRLQISSAGFLGYVDLWRYFTVSFGYRVPVGQVQASFGPPDNLSSQAIDYTVTQVELSGELKYPFEFGHWFSIAPKIGLEGIFYMSGGVVGAKTDDDLKAYFDSWLAIAGVDLNVFFGPQAFLRIPVDVGIGLNSRLPDSVYSHNSWSYTSSSIVSGKVGCLVGYAY
jgi:hypothetical protein